jgi:hypothetical protein
MFQIDISSNISLTPVIVWPHLERVLRNIQFHKEGSSLKVRQIKYPLYVSSPETRRHCQITPAVRKSSHRPTADAKVTFYANVVTRMRLEIL